MTTPYGIYVHIPWCRVRCPYCAFYVHPDRERPEWTVFVHRLVEEYTRWRPYFPGPAATIFLGGGTPSRLPPQALRALLQPMERADGAEVSSEANPEDVDQAWLEGALGAGINRISLGVQTFNPRFARLLNRAHKQVDAPEVCRALARSPLRSWSLDLIFALPGQTLVDLDEDLDQLLDVEPPHVALYGLTYEPGTPFHRARQRGKLLPPPDDLWRRMYDHIHERLHRAGLDRYEVSNYARAGHRCLHNGAYWSDGPYMGLGPSAHGYLPDGRRSLTPPDLAGYLQGTAPATLERPTPAEAAADLMISSLRGVEGLSLQRLIHRTGLRPAEATIQLLQAGGVLRAHPHRLQLTEAGYPIADAIISRLIDDLAPP